MGKAAGRSAARISPANRASTSAQDALIPHGSNSDLEISVRTTTTVLHPRDNLTPCRHRRKDAPQARAPHAGLITVQAGLLTCGSTLCFRLPGQRRAQWPRGTELAAY